MANISLIWDIENVTPPANNSLFLDSLWEYAESLGRVVAAKAYADWSGPGFQKLAVQLKKYQFYMVHVPSERKKKNSVDIQLVSDTLEILRLYDHIDHIVLVTGDSDFRPLLLTLRRAGKMTHIVCDIKTASQELLAIADSFVDYRDILPNEEEDVIDSRANEELSPEYWYSALAETVGILSKEGKPANFSNVKIRMKMLNPNFSEQKLGFSRWGDFISSGVKQKVVMIVEKDGNPTLGIPDSQTSKDKGVLQKGLKLLVDTLKEMDAGKVAQFHDYSIVSSRLREKKIDLKALGFSQFKKFIQAADVRGLVETRTEGMNNSVRLTAN